MRVVVGWDGGGGARCGPFTVGDVGDGRWVLGVGGGRGGVVWSL